MRAPVVSKVSTRKKVIRKASRVSGRKKSKNKNKKNAVPEYVTAKKQSGDKNKSVAKAA